MQANTTPLVGIVMGSDSDFKIMKKAALQLDEFGIPYEMLVASAHRSPEKALKFSAEAAEKGMRVIIAGAGAAAHLPGVLAAKTTLPVIGVPINATALNGVDALYAIVQMPSGIPVATVGIDGAKNAAILAAEMLALADDSLQQKLVQYKEDMAAGVAQKDAKLQDALREMKEEK
ncbi:5-(carboxyamino)imidazole ribonucleotide mutase [Peptococcus simiae]|uniref:N5-carboxyaminoimidazole ribonucleotide mutase n=1 Tax=Peptococcus simiae TaxID=1643805 RepID=A0ABW9H1K5_9FIRM